MSASTEPAAAGPFDRPMSRDGAAAALERLRRERPDLMAAAVPAGCRRGIEAYLPDTLDGVWQRACNNFHAAHGRFPDLAALPTTADHFFAMKFFDPIPLRPFVPADRLRAPELLPQPLRGQVGHARRVWDSTALALPADDAVPPGDYWLKISNGNNAQRRVRWPPDAAARAALLEAAALWWAAPYGVGWGEWWYGLVRPRLYLECDLSARMQDRPEIKVFLREGRVKLLYGIRLHKDGPNEQSYFDAELRPLEGRSAVNRPLACALPDTIGLMLRAAEALGRGLRLARIDFLNAAGPRPCLGEITLCHTNARRILAPPEFDARAKRLLFE